MNENNRRVSQPSNKKPLLRRGDCTYITQSNEGIHTTTPITFQTESASAATPSAIGPTCAPDQRLVR